MSTARPVRGRAPVLVGLACACLTTSVFATPLSEALSQSTASLSLRLRHESAEQDNGLRRAQASGLRHRIGLSSGDWHGFSATLESEGTVAIGEERYNSGPGGNGNSEYSVVADPTGNELNQAYVSYAAGAGTLLRVGRQRIIFDNARFVGNVGWRQNEQTYDAALLKSSPLEGLTLQYAYLGNVNRIFFDNVDLDGHLLNLKADLLPMLSATVYGYFLDYMTGEDTRTLGLRLSGDRALSGVKLRYSAEFARQSDHADSSDIEADYLAGEIGLSRGPLGLGIGFEVLGSDGSRGFSTPLATLHKFNGFADLFLATPAAGLQDVYARLGYKLGKWSLLAFYHQFEADAGSQDYGDEVDFVAVYKHSKSQSLGFKYADYAAQDFGVDTRKFTVDLNYSF